MKLSDFLTDVGRPIAYYPKLANIIGSVKATVFLCQLFYWKGKGSDPDGWIYKTAGEWQEETGLSYDEQRGARKTLTQAGLLEEKYKRIDHQMMYRIKAEELNKMWERHFPILENPNSGNSETPVGEPGEPEVVNKNAENTSETTTEIKTPGADAPKERNSPKPPKEKKEKSPRERNLVFDAIAQVTGPSDPELLALHVKSNGSYIAKAAHNGAAAFKPEQIIDWYSPPSGWWYSVHCNGIANPSQPRPTSITKTIALAAQWEKSGRPQPKAPQGTRSYANNSASIPTSQVPNFHPAPGSFRQQEDDRIAAERRAKRESERG